MIPRLEVQMEDIRHVLRVSFEEPKSRLLSIRMTLCTLIACGKEALIGLR